MTGEAVSQQRGGSRVDMRWATRLDFNQAAPTAFDLQHRVFRGITRIRTRSTGRGAELEILRRGTSRPCRRTIEIIPIPDVSLRLQPGNPPRPGIPRLHIPGVGEDAPAAERIPGEAGPTLVAEGRPAAAFTDKKQQRLRSLCCLLFVFYRRKRR